MLEDIGLIFRIYLLKVIQDQYFYYIPGVEGPSGWYQNSTRSYSNISSGSDYLFHVITWSHRFTFLNIQRNICVYSGIAISLYYFSKPCIPIHYWKWRLSWFCYQGYWILNSPLSSWRDQKEGRKFTFYLRRYIDLVLLSINWINEENIKQKWSGRSTPYLMIHVFE